MKKFYLLLILVITVITGCGDDDSDSNPINFTASIASSTTSLQENGGTATITVSLNQANQGSAIPFSLAFSGTATLDEDYSVSSSSGTIPNGSSSATFTLTVIDDQDDENDENITVSVSFAGNTNVTVGNNNTVSLTITDDDGGNTGPTNFMASITSSATSIQENGGTANITVSLDDTNDGSPIAFDLNLSGTATENEDYTISSEMRTIPNGSSSRIFTITATDDQDVENDENVMIAISFANGTNVTVGNNSSVSITITDDDTNTSTCSGTADSYSIDLDPSGCKESAEADLGVTSVYTVSVSGNTRTITSNGIPDHNVGMFPNMGNPNSISVQNKTFSITVNPTKGNSTTSLTTSNGQPRYWFGILDNSVILAPIAAEFFTNTSTGEDNRDWNENALSSNINLGTDCNNSHVFPTGRYHHHATPSAFIEDRNITGSTTTQVGWAADGFPIYYKYGNKGGSVMELASSFRLKTTERGGDDVSAPAGCPDGTYTQDYEFVDGLGDLDECNGYDDPVLGYIYVITDTYPSIPRCFMATPSDDFLNN